jgi:hypothetical protein
VPHAVRPVVAQVVQDQRQHPQPDIPHRPFGQPVSLVHGDVDAQAGNLGEGSGQLAQKAMVQAGDGIWDVVDLQSTTVCPPGLQQDGQQEYRDGEKNGIHGSLSRSALPLKRTELPPGLTYAVRLPRCKKKTSVDRHYLTPLFDPKSIVVYG